MLQLAALHNAGNIDLLALAAAPEFLNLDRRQLLHNTTDLSLALYRGWRRRRSPCWRWSDASIT